MDKRKAASCPVRGFAAQPYALERQKGDGGAQWHHYALIRRSCKVQTVLFCGQHTIAPLPNFLPAVDKDSGILIMPPCLNRAVDITAQRARSTSRFSFRGFCERGRLFRQSTRLNQNALQHGIKTPAARSSLMRLTISVA